MISHLRPAAVLLVAIFASTSSAADGRPMTVADLFAFQRVAAPQISPDGKTVVYAVTDVSLEENKSTTALWLASTDGKAPPQQLTDPKGKRDGSPRWSPDGATILFDSNRSGSSQLWTVPAGGGEPKQTTDISTGAGQGIWSPDGTKIAFASAVYSEFSEKPFAESDRLNREKDEAKEKNPVQARVFTKLFFRHWDSYVEDKRQHIFVIDASPVRAGFAVPRDVTPGDRDAVPTSMTFSSGDDFTFTPDSKHLVFTAVPAKNEAWSTNHDLCRVSITNTATDWDCLTSGNPAADGGPKFSTNGKKLAWRAQDKPGYEADKWDILVAACNPDGTLVGKPSNCTAKFDLSVNEFTWNGGYDRAFIFTADHKARNPIFMAQVEGIGYKLAYEGGSCGSLSASLKGNFIAFTEARMDRPAEVMTFWWPGEEKPTLVSHANDDLLAKLDLPRPESVEVAVEGGVKMQMWVLKPPGFDPKKKWPVVYMIHGGPQGAWDDSWSFRWNPELWAAQGYVLVLPNPRGSSGFGEKFKEEISGDWGGKCYRDLVAGLELVKKLPYVDTDRLATAGASFGGYMQNWFAVNDIVKEFKCQINHCSVWNFESMWGTTEELWFDEYEHGGLPWQVPGKYREFSPHVKAGNLAKYKVPMLVIQNDLDFRCPVGQGHELFSALQRQGVPSRMINFPDEGHWVLKPKNSEYWHREVFEWLKNYCPPGGR
jgi:dipeptidyl aminopeptidase/acylaminoacyl peptidase